MLFRHLARADSLARFRSVTHLGARETKLRFKNKLFSFDGEMIDTCFYKCYLHATRKDGASDSQLAGSD